MIKKCVCGKEYEVSNYDAERGRGKFCSKECANRNKEGRQSEETMRKNNAVMRERQSENANKVKTTQITADGRVVCYPVCKASDLKDYICQVCGEDMGKYLKDNKDKPQSGREKKVPKGFLKREIAFNEQYRSRPCPPSERLYTPEQTAAKMAKLKELMKIWNSEPKR